jgi:hypothetical protein
VIKKDKSGYKVVSKKKESWGRIQDAHRGAEAFASGGVFQAQGLDHFYSSTLTDRHERCTVKP